MPSNRFRRWGRRSAALVAAVVATSMALAGCSAGGSSPDATGGDKPSLTIALATPPTSLDPSKGSGGTNAIFQLPAYSTLFHVAEIGGDPEGALAESYEWLDDSNQTLQVTLREGLKFSDGTALDSAAVKASIEHFATGGSVFGYVALPIASIDTPDELTVVFNLAQPTPTFPTDLAEGPGMGSIISTDALGTDALGTSTAGAGPYMLSKDGTVEGSEYRYVANPEYYDADSVPYSAVTIKVIADPNTALASLQSGQLDISYGYPDTYQQATGGDGVNADVKNTTVDGLWIQDWTGDLIPALGDVRVRQAINYAIDREGITEAITLGLGSATMQNPLEGTLGYDEALNETYPYDTDKAKELLQEAGYADGFELPIIVPSFIPTANALSQALAAQLAEVGITVTITGANTFPEYAQAQEGGTFGGTVVPLDMTQGIPTAMGNVFAPQGLVNPRHGELPDVLASAGAAAAQSGEAADAAWQETNALLVNGAYAAPVMAEPVIYYYNDKVGSLSGGGVLNPVFVTPAS